MVCAFIKRLGVQGVALYYNINIMVVYNVEELSNMFNAYIDLEQLKHSWNTTKDTNIES